MLARILVPLQYLYFFWLAEKKIALAYKSGPGHLKALRRAERAVVQVEDLQQRFPEVTDWIDDRRQRDAIRNRASSKELA